MFGADGEIGTSAFKLWLAVGSAVFVIGFYLLAYLLPRYVIARALRAGFAIVGIGLGAATAWALLDYASSSEPRSEWRSLEVRTVGAKMVRALLDYTPSSEPRAERRALEVRAGQLNARVLAPGSPLACLDALAGEEVETACEKALFTSPATVAAATSFVADRLELLAAMLAYEKRGAADIDGLLRPLRRSLEADRFGFLAHVMALRDDCASQNCKALALLDDPGRVRTNLSGETFDHYVEHYAEIWAKVPDSPVVDAVQPSPQPPHKTLNIDFPTAASIPPVSIMIPEPTGPVAARGAANPDPQQASTPAARRTRKTAPNASSPQTLAQPATANSETTTEPIWPEPMPPPPSPTSAAASGSVQPPNGNSTARAQ